MSNEPNEGVDPTIERMRADAETTALMARIDAGYHADPTHAANNPPQDEQ